MESYKAKTIFCKYHKLALCFFLICFPLYLSANSSQPLPDWSHSTSSHAIQKIVLPKPKGYADFLQMVFSSDNSLVATFVRSRSKPTKLLVWSTQDGSLIASTEFPLDRNPAEFGHLAFTPDNTHLVYTENDGHISFSWGFRQNKRSKLGCFIGSSFSHVTNNSVLARPADWVEHLHDIKTCEIIALSPMMGTRAIIGKDNKLLWISYRKVAEELKRQWFYLEPSYDSSSFKKKYGHAVDLMDLEPGISTSNYSRPYEQIFYNHPNHEFLLKEYDGVKVKLSLWDYAEKKNIWKKTFKRDDLFTQKEGSLQPVKKLHLHTDFKQRKIYLVGRKSIAIIELDSGKVIKKITFPKGSIARNWSGDFEGFNSPFFISASGKKIILEDNDAVEVLSLEDGSILSRLDTGKLTRVFHSQISGIKNSESYICQNNQWHCLFKAQSNVSPNARYMSFGKSYTLPNQQKYKVWYSNIIADMVTSKPIISLHQHEITRFVQATNGITLFLSSSNNPPYELVLWKMKPLSIAVTEH